MDEYFSDSECLPCNAICDSGCVRDSNCNKCIDDECEANSCKDWESCESCIPNAELVDGNCQCRDTYFYNPENDTCDRCSDGCLICEDDTNCTCSVCMTGYYLIANHTICVPECPTGYTANFSSNTCEGTSPYLAYVFLFDQNELDYTANNGITRHVSGNSEGGIQARDAHDPIPLYKRGMYYDGEDNYSEILDATLNPDFTIELWVRSADPNVD